MKKKGVQVGAGRPLKMTNVTLRKMRLCYLRGMTDTEVSKIIDVSLAALKEWRKKYPKLMAMVTDWKRYADDEIELSLFERAKGYCATDTKFATHEGEITDEKEYIKEYPPDVGAITLWLTNRRKEEWRSKPEVEIKLPRPVVLEGYDGKKEYLGFEEEEKED